MERRRFAELEQALEAAQRRAQELATASSTSAVDLRVRRFEPVQQVTARIEIAGPERLLPSVRAGVDVRGDGSVEAYRGRVRREVIAPRGSETPYDALRRVLQQS